MSEAGYDGETCMTSETTKRQIREIDDGMKTGHCEDRNWTASELHHLCQAKLALVKALEIQERMEREAKPCSHCGGRGEFGKGVSRVACAYCNGSAGCGE